MDKRTKQLLDDVIKDLSYVNEFYSDSFSVSCATGCCHSVVTIPNELLIIYNLLDSVKNKPVFIFTGKKKRKRKK